MGLIYQLKDATRALEWPTTPLINQSLFDICALPAIGRLFDLNSCKLSLASLNQAAFTVVEKAEKTPGKQTETLLTGWLNKLSHDARQHPARDAVTGYENSLAQGELENRVTALARRLRETGVVHGDRVAVCLERSPHYVVAFLAVLRVGGTYVPIDAQYPAARVSAMLEYTPGALITTQSILESLPKISCPVIFADNAPMHQDSDAPASIDAVADTQPAYLMFTSGSTGAANGVLVSRGALAGYIATLQASFSLSHRDVYLHSASFSFSASIRQIVAPLAAGATMVIADEQARHDPYRLLEIMQSSGVTVWDTVPSLWRIVERVIYGVESRHENEILPETLRLILLTGEPLSWALVSAWKRHLRSSVTVINLYSQTETAGTVSMFPIPAGDVPETGNVPLGTPLGNMALLVLDEDLNPVKPGHEGEIYVVSDHLAEGYQGLDELTGSRFLSGAEVGSENRRVFRTGDFVRLGADGSLVPVGRRDHRVKVRGFRVDLQEIETELTHDPGIEQAVVQVEDSTRLIAYVMPAAGEHPRPAEVQDRLRKTLPDHAVPAQVVVVDRIPVTANGKVDREALARLRDRKPEATRKEAAMADETETRLLQIWEQSLAYKGAGLKDDFFENGGDSITAVSLFLEIEDHFGIRLPPSTLMSAGTLGGLAALIRERSVSNEPSPVLVLRKEGHLPPLFIVHAISAHLPHFKELVKLLDPELPVFALEPIHNTEVTSRQPDIARVVRQYAREIRKKHPTGPFFLGGWSIGGFMAFSVATELESMGDNPAELLLLDAMSPVLRPQMPRKKNRGLDATRSYLRNLVVRQIRSFRLSPREQFERMAWMVRGAARRFVANFRKPARHNRGQQVLENVTLLADQFQPPPYTGSAVLFRSQQPSVDPSQDEDLGWSKYVHGSLEVIHLPGDHITMVIEPKNMKLLATHISEIVNREFISTPIHHQHGKSADHDMMDLFLEESEKLAGQQYTERLPWTNSVSKDAIRHFAFAICDDNPLWVDESYAGARSTGPMQAPPGILIAARYPVLHGAPLDVPLISLLKDIEYTWERSIHDGEEFRSTAEQGDVREVVDPDGNRRIYIDAHITYRNAHDQVLGRARSTVVRMLSQGRFQVDDWSVYRYSPEELERIIEGINSEVRTGSRRLSENEFSVGTHLPSIVRGPLTIGDMVCWHAGIGPSYRPGPLGYKDTLKTPQFRVRNPVTGWPIKYMLQHEDVNLAHQRGMPAPFDNGVMRFAWVSPLITNWMGDEGFLSRLHVRINQPVLYGDTCWYSGEVTERSREADHWRVGVRLSGTNQRGVITTTGSAEVLLRD